jgi:hypothetical protein
MDVPVLEFRRYSRLRMRTAFAASEKGTEMDWRTDVNAGPISAARRSKGGRILGIETIGVGFPVQL